MSTISPRATSPAEHHPPEIRPPFAPPPGSWVGIPLGKVLRLPSLLHYRRSLRLLSFFYASLHMATYVVLDLAFDASVLWDDLRKRPYIAAVAGVVHFFWLVKADLREPSIYAAITAGLFALRALPVRARPPGRQERTRKIVPDTEERTGERGQG